MNKTRCFLLFVVLLLPAGLSFAASDASPDRDADLRAAIRLADLGYLTSPASLAKEDALAAARDAFCVENSLSPSSAVPETLFSRDAKPAPFPGSGIPLPETPLSTGIVRSAETVGQQLLPGETYAATDCGTGVVYYLTCANWSAHAVMEPSRDWDATTLARLLGENNPYAKRPVTLALNGEAIAASLEPESGAPGRFGLFFSGCTAGFNGIEDADRVWMLAYASGSKSAIL